jgi:molybdate transport system substrate-binding protein
MAQHFVSKLRIGAQRIAVAAALAISGPAAAQDSAVTVFAAASLRNVIDELGPLFTARADVRVVASYAASSALARQIEQGAPADVFLSADIDWMDWMGERRLVRADTRVDLLGNRLVLIAPRTSSLAMQAIGPGFDPTRLIGPTDRIATGEVRAVPVGRYAQQALVNLGTWAAVQPRLAQVENVRLALALVARGEAPLGIVYATDAQAEPGVKVIGTFPAETHAPIVYPVAATATARPGAARFIAFLRSPEARIVFERHGFAVLVDARPFS